MRRAGWLAVACMVAACAGDPEPAATPEPRACGDTSCEADAFCVATQGAVCMPLPPPGESCQLGCVLTEHCCNCTAYACVEAEPCADGPSCACLDDAGDDILPYCEADRRECSDVEQGADVLCIAVALDEDPFAD